MIDGAALSESIGNRTSSSGGGEAEADESFAGEAAGQATEGRMQHQETQEPAPLEAAAEGRLPGSLVHSSDLMCGEAGRQALFDRLSREDARGERGGLTLAGEGVDHARGVSRHEDSLLDGRFRREEDRPRSEESLGARLAG